jgi:hypothetical protein
MYNISYPLDVPLPFNLYDIKIYCLSKDKSMMNWRISEGLEYFRYVIEYSDINGDWVKVNTILCGKNPNYNEYLVSIPNFNHQTLYRLSLIKYDGTVEIVKTLKSVNCGSEQVVKVYPNPTESTFKIETPEFMSEYELMILDNLGKVVYSKNCSGWQETVGFENFNEGIYFIRLMSEGNILYQTKISKIGNNN